MKTLKLETHQSKANLSRAIVKFTENKCRLFHWHFISLPQPTT